jgi:putative DNA primase/helicase
MAVAREFVAERYVLDGDVLALRHHRNTFFRWAGDHWPEDDERRVCSELWHYLEDAVYMAAKTIEPFKPTRNKVANVLEALKAIGHISQGAQPPFWLDGDDVTPINAGETVALANGILDFMTRTLSPHTARFFGHHVLPFAYEPEAPAPTRWLRFLDELWPEDEESMATLGEWFGYVLSNDTSLQKMFMLVGPKRSGKGTIARVLTGLLGRHNVAAPTLAGLTMNFGLQTLIGKPLAVISDARLGSRADSSIAVERLLSISGEDVLTVDRKYRDHWTGQIPSRVMILTNELPRLADSSGALASRFVMSILTESFYGRENPALTNELLEESAGIFNWALEGLDRLRERGHFLTPASAIEAQRQLEDLASPVGAFVRDRCVVGPTREVRTDTLWSAWRVWCAEEGRERPGTKAVFTRDLRASVPGIRPVRFREGERRVYGYRGIELAEESTGPRTTPDPFHDETHGPGWSGVPSILDRTPDAEARKNDLARESGRPRTIPDLAGGDDA